MRKYVPLLMILAAGCATTTPPASTPAARKPGVEAAPGITADRIGKICALSSAERERELEKLKKESGMVLYCGNK